MAEYLSSSRSAVAQGWQLLLAPLMLTAQALELWTKRLRSGLLVAQTEKMGRLRLASKHWHPDSTIVSAATPGSRPCPIAAHSKPLPALLLDLQQLWGRHLPAP